MMRYAHILVVICTLPGTVAGLLTGENVLCISKGHVAIEPVCASAVATLQRPICCADAAEDHSAEVAASSSPNSCGQCIDLPGLRSPTTSTSTSLDSPWQHAAFVLTPCPSMVAIEPASTQGMLPVPDILISSREASLTTILLI